MQTLMSRIKAPTPSWFQRIIRVGLILSAIGGALLAAPIVLPSIVTTIAGYMVTAGAVAAAIAKTAQAGE